MNNNMGTYLLNVSIVIYGNIYYNGIVRKLKRSSEGRRVTPRIQQNTDSG